jgi:hypothetical protein
MEISSPGAMGPVNPVAEFVMAVTTTACDAPVTTNSTEIACGLFDADDATVIAP